MFLESKIFSKRKRCVGLVYLHFAQLILSPHPKKKLNTGNPRLRYQYRAKQMFISRLQLKH